MLPFHISENPQTQGLLSKLIPAHSHEIKDYHYRDSTHNIKTKNKTGEFIS